MEGIVSWDNTRVVRSGYAGEIPRNKHWLTNSWDASRYCNRASSSSSSENDNTNVTFVSSLVLFLLLSKSFLLWIYLSWHRHNRQRTKESWQRLNHQITIMVPLILFLKQHQWQRCCQLITKSNLIKKATLHLKPR